MGKKILIGITIFLMSAFIAGWYLFTREAKYFGTSAFKAVSEEMSVILRVHNPSNYVARSLKNPVWSTYSRFPAIGNLYQKMTSADSLFRIFPAAKTLFSAKDLTIMIQDKDQKFTTLYLVEMSSLSEKRTFSDDLDQYFTKEGAVRKAMKVGKSAMNNYSWTENGDLVHLYLSFCQGLLLVSFDQQMIENAIAQIEVPNHAVSDIFEKANRTATQNEDLNIYLNHRKISNFTDRFFTPDFTSHLKSIIPFAEWSELDLTQKADELLFNGFSFIRDTTGNYLQILRRQKPGSFNLSNILPSETSFILSFVISDNVLFFKDYEKYLKQKKLFDAYRNSLDQISVEYGIDFQQIIINNLQGAAAMIYTKPDPFVPDENRYLLFKVQNGIKVEDTMMPLAKVAGEDISSKTDKNPLLYSIDKETIFRIYKMPIPDFGEKVFGDVFRDVTTNYYTIYNNCLIMGASPESLGRFLRSNVYRQTLGDNQAYHEFLSQMSAQLNLFIWGIPTSVLPFFEGCIQPKWYEEINKQMADLRKTESVGWQITSENGMFYNMARLKYNPKVYQQVSTPLSWRRALGRSSVEKLQLVLEPGNKGAHEIIVQDGDHNLFLFSSQGEILWKIKLSEAINSEIFQLNTFRNGQFQFFFSTASALHMIGHDGKYIKNFPLKFHAPATNGVAVVDYENNGDYRFFIASNDHRVNLYDKRGRVIADWNPRKTDSDVDMPIQFFRVSGKDYIVFADKNRGYILDRRGKTRVSVKEDVLFSQNRFTLEPGTGKKAAQLVNTDTNGDVVMINFNGSVKRLSLGHFSANHQFVFEDVNSDKKPDYLFLDGDSVVAFDQNTKQLFKRQFKTRIIRPAELFTFPDGSRKIGIIDSDQSRIYLFQPDGSQYNGFPLEGNSRFAINFRKDEESSFDVITATPDGYLSCYKLKY